MRKLLSIVLIGLSVGANARQITSDEAISVASDFMKASDLRIAQSVNSSLRPMKAPGVDLNSSANPYYVFNRGENDGFVIISGDDRAPKILGYSDKGSFDAENLPPQLKAMMESWAKQMAELPEVGQHASWQKSASTRTEDGVLLETAEWGQGYPYNALCPIIEGEQAPTGCIATAMAIAMKYHNWPDYTRGDLQNDFESPGVSFDFSNYVIDWDNLSDKDNKKFGEEVSKLMLSAGVAAQMNYGSMESSAYDWPYAHQMMQFYTYSKDCQYIERKKFDDSEWHELIQTQLTEIGPVIYRGSNTVGHAFIIDGFDNDTLYHVNWGWDGMLNGFYNIDFSEMGFDQFQGMVINIKPDLERREYSKSFIPNVDAYIAGAYECEGWNFMSPDIIPGEKMHFRMPFTCLNEHVGAYGIAVVDEDDNILQVLDDFNYNSGIRVVCPWPGNDPTLDLVFPELKEGQRYQIVSQEIESAINPGYVPAHEPSMDPKDWKIVLGGMIYPSYFYDKGNRSDLAEVKYHIDESMPFFAMVANTMEHNFTKKELKGVGCWENLLRPKKGISVEVKGFDKEGNLIDPLYSGGEVLEEPTFGINISMYSDSYEVNVKYEYDGDSRKDGSFSEDSIIEDNGLIYHIEDKELSLIGYDDIPEIVIIPDIIESEGKKYKVTKIDDDALLFAPAKELIINSSSLMSIGNCAFAGMNNLKSVSFDKTGLSTSSWVMPFLKTQVKNVYLESFNIANLVSQAMNYSYGSGYDSCFIGNTDIDFYISIVDANPYIYNLFLNEAEEISVNSGYEKVMNSFNIPGVGTEIFQQLLEIYHLPIRQMWSYEIDRDHGLISIGDILDNVMIERVIINGIVTEKNRDGLYEWSINDFGDVDEVIVEYTVNANKKMKTHYSSFFNSNIKNTYLAKTVESIQLTPDNWSGVEGESFKIEAMVLPEDALDKTLIWASSDETVANVDGEGNVSVLKEGTCVITATAADGSGVAAECIITSVSGVDYIFSAKQEFDVYNIDGSIIKKCAGHESLKQLTPGLYIIKGNHEIKKVFIR